MEWYEILGMSLAIWLVVSVVLALMVDRTVCSGSSDGVGNGDTRPLPGFDLDDRRGA